MTRMWKHPELGPIEVGDKDEAAAVCRKPMLGKTFARYVREGVGKSTGNRCPQPVTVNPDTRRDEWWLDQVRAWDLRRPGPGDHGGLGSHAYRQAALVRGLKDAPTIDEVIAAAKKPKKNAS